MGCNAVLFLCRLLVLAVIVGVAIPASDDVAMSKQLTDAEHREFLDGNFPFVEQGAEPPGRYVDGEFNGHPVRRWSGQTNWSTRHGAAVVRWSRGRPIFVEDAALPDGTQVRARDAAGSGLHHWRYQASAQPRRWIHGRIEIHPDRVIFVVGRQPTYNPPAAGEFPDLEFDLAHDKSLRDRLIDADFADALYAYLKNGDFWKAGGDRIWSIGLSGAAGLVADLRGHGDVYTDYYPHGGNTGDHRAAVFAEISELLKKISWRRPTAEDLIEAAAFTRRDLDLWEGRAPASAQEWTLKLKMPAHHPGAVALVARSGQQAERQRLRQAEHRELTLEKRLHALAVSGRVSETEYLSMGARIRQIP
jgi:hypothetical protein